MSEAIKAQYRVLTDLRRVDEKVLRFQADIVRIPEEIAKIDAAVSERKSALDKAKATMDAAEKNQREAERELKEKEENLRKAESKMMEVKTNEEYQAAMKENEAQKQAKGGLEERAIKLMSEVEAARQAYREVEKGFKDYEASMKAERNKLDEERGKLVNLLEEQLQKRQGMAKQLDGRLASLYERLTTRARGAPVVLVDNGMCRGCNMVVRPQLYNEVIGFKAIHQCPNCSKILLPKNLDNELSSDPTQTAV